ncbi:sulfotransferase family protein [Nocardiopsis rhodophaea]|uniref:Sulfotransferase family protein n=1 Tax=Nocardiopsis rhodophaea TaxID=280238 RepID=A0ABP5EXB2_9ACTN
MLQVIGAGMPRTGTASMKAALEQLGFGPCHHMYEVIQRPEQSRRWSRVLTDDPVDWEYLLEGYRSAVDWPSSYFWRDLAAAYPDAKVILTRRDPRRWYASCKNTIFEFNARAARGENIGRSSEHEEFRQAVLDVMFQTSFGATIADIPAEEPSIAGFERHNAAVIETVPADRLLIYEPGDGWEPLCDFLEVDAPADAPFPHLNEGQEMRRMLQEGARTGRFATPFDRRDDAGTATRELG